MATVVVHPASSLRGCVRVPGDKSMSHRYALLAALADGVSVLRNYAPGADCAATLSCLEALGATITGLPPEGPHEPGYLRIVGRGLGGLRAPAAPLECGNSGSTMRMLAGVVAAHHFTSILVGDPSLSRRPMRRIIEPLTRMGARIEAADGARPPVTIHGSSLAGITFTPETPSAQVKSAVLLAGLQARGRTQVIEAVQTRDHTERALAAFGAAISCDEGVAVEGGQRLHAIDARVPGDLSSAAFLAVAAAAQPGSELRLDQVGLNPSRTALLAVLERAGARVVVERTDEWQGEPVGTITIRHQALAEIAIAPAEVPGLIDELPVLGAMATFGGAFRVTGAGELRVKESDRITALVTGLRALGADADELADGFEVRAGGPLAGGTVDAHGDHRLAMAFAVAALGARGPVAIEGAEAVAVSYPGFFADLERLRA